MITYGYMFLTINTYPDSDSYLASVIFSSFPSKVTKILLKGTQDPKPFINFKQSLLIKYTVNF